MYDDLFDQVISYPVPGTAGLGEGKFGITFSMKTVHAPVVAHRNRAWFWELLTWQPMVASIL
jgi:hypothetical protein